MLLGTMLLQAHLVVAIESLKRDVAEIRLWLAKAICALQEHACGRDAMQGYDVGAPLVSHAPMARALDATCRARRP